MYICKKREQIMTLYSNIIAIIYGLCVYVCGHVFVSTHTYVCGCVLAHACTHLFVNKYVSGTCVCTY